jgi:hypothetical protein
MLTFTSLDQNTLQARRTLRHKKAPGNFPIPRLCGNPENRLPTEREAILLDG